MSDGPPFENGPHAVCFTCGGLRHIAEPRLYQFQATEEVTAGITVNEWRTCPQCQGAGKLPGLFPPA